MEVFRFYSDNCFQEFSYKRFTCNGISENTIGSKQYFFSKIFLEVECMSSTQKHRRFSRSSSLIWRNRRPSGTAWFVSSLLSLNISSSLPDLSIRKSVLHSILELSSVNFSIVFNQAFVLRWLLPTTWLSAQLITWSLNKTINTTTYSNFLCNSL